MKAITIHQYGSPDVLNLQEVPMPTPGKNEVLIKVRAAAANPLDWHCMRGTPKIMRLSSGLSRPKYRSLGADLSGTVEAVGSSVTGFRPGDEVFGDTSVSSLGAFAEFACAPAASLAIKPANLTFEEAAALPVAAITALQSLYAGKLQAGQKVLINGASGGVGTFTVQLAKAYGAHVTGVCSTRNLELVRSIGADEVIDYAQVDFCESSERYDLTIDNVGNRTAADHQKIIAPGGRCVIVGFTTMGLLIRNTLAGVFTSRRKIVIMGSAQPNQKDLNTLRELVEAGKVKPVIDRCYPLGETAAAIRYLEEGHATGKVVITLDA